MNASFLSFDISFFSTTLLPFLPPPPLPVLFAGYVVILTFFDWDTRVFIENVHVAVQALTKRIRDNHRATLKANR